MNVALCAVLAKSDHTWNLILLLESRLKEMALDDSGRGKSGLPSVPDPAA